MVILHICTIAYVTNSVAAVSAEFLSLLLLNDFDLTCSATVQSGALPMFTPQPGTVFHSPGINSPQPPSSGDTLRLSCSLAQAPTPVENAADINGAIQVHYITTNHYIPQLADNKRLEHCLPTLLYVNNSNKCTLKSWLTYISGNNNQSPYKPE